uniref:Uncharacterized protein n=1 Tax=Steinernema glaseri TaxID=37863 RepID=A0A1I7Z6Q9_9BILA
MLVDILLRAGLLDVELDVVRSAVVPCELNLVACLCMHVQ